MEASPPSHKGRWRQMERPITASMMLKRKAVVKAWRKMLRAADRSLAPILWATCTEKPVEQAEHKPPKSHVVVVTNPMEAEASAPRLPTIEASIYCMTMEENWATTAGTLNHAASSSLSRRVISLP